MNTIDHRFDQLGCDLVRSLLRRWRQPGVWLAAVIDRFAGWRLLPRPGADHEIHWDDGEPEDKL